MAVARLSSSGRWCWIAVLAIAGSVLATVEASAHEMIQKDRWVGVNGAISGRATVPTSHALGHNPDLSSRRLIDMGRSACAEVPRTHLTAFADLGDPHMPFGDVQASRRPVPLKVKATRHARAFLADQVALVSRLRPPRLEGVLVLCSDKVRCLHDLVAPVANDPNDDETSNDPRDDDDPDRRDDLDWDENTDSLAIGWFPELVLYLIDLRSVSAARTEAPPTLPLAPKRLRC